MGVAGLLTTLEFFFTLSITLQTASLELYRVRVGRVRIGTRLARVELGSGRGRIGASLSRAELGSGRGRIGTSSDRAEFGSALTELAESTTCSRPSLTLAGAGCK